MLRSKNIQKVLNYLGLLTVFLFTISSLTTCKTTDLGQPTLAPSYEQDIKQWQQERLASLTQPNGWFSLVGLYWLKEGENKCGSGKGNQIVLPGTVPSFVGSYTLNKGTVNCSIEEQKGLSSISEGDCNMTYESISWRLIERGGNYGVRVKDTLRPSYIRLLPINYFDVNPSYQVYAKWTDAADEDSLMMRNVLDMEYAIPIEGNLTFKLNDASYTLTALDGGPNDLFLVFSDETTGDLTYGGGRYLYCPRPNEKNITIIDFNKAHNPPCAFTDFATCLLPRPENHLSLELLAGEQTYGDH